MALSTFHSRYAPITTIHFQDLPLLQRLPLTTILLYVSLSLTSLGTLYK